MRRAAIAAIMLLAAIPAAYALGPNPSIQPEPRMTLFTDGSIEVHSRYGHETVHIWGTFVDDGSDAWQVVIRVTDPDGAVVEQEFTVRDTRYDTYHAIHGSDMRLEGWHKVNAYLNQTRPVQIGTAEFYVDVRGYERPDIRLDIVNASAYAECIPKCYKVAIGGHRNNEYQVAEGGTVEWNNRGLDTHRIYSQAIGYGGADPEITTEVGDGPNEFDTNILRLGGTIQVRFEKPGTVLFTCLFHPWMEGLLVVRAADGGPDGGDVGDRPAGVADILEREEIEEEKNIAEETASGAPGGAGGPGGGAAARLSVSLDVNGDADLLGGVIEADIAFSQPHGYRIAVNVQNENGTVETVSAKTGSGGTATVRVPVQPTWGAGTYTVAVSNNKAWGIPSVSASKTIEITGKTPCLGDADTSTCYAGFAERVWNDGSVMVKGKRIHLAFLDAAGTADAVSAMCIPNGTGAVATIDMDPGAGRKTGTVWCGGAMVNAALLDDGTAALRDAGCAKGETAQRLAAHCIEEEPEEGSAEEFGQDVWEEVGPDSDCPIALVSYGTYLAGPVQELREVRQGIISGGHGWIIDGLHSAYYVAAPHAADVLRGSDHLRQAALSYISVPSMAGAWVL